MWVTKLLISPVKKDFLPISNPDPIWPEIGIFGQFGAGHAGLFGALLVGQWPKITFPRSKMVHKMSTWGF